MFTIELVRVHKHNEQGIVHFATVTHVLTRLYTTPNHLSEKSLDGWIRDFRRNLRNTMCLWCGDPAQYVEQIDDLEIFGFCSENCYTLALLENHDEEMTRR